LRGWVSTIVLSTPADAAAAKMVDAHEVTERLFVSEQRWLGL
jgi:hypothetical protein